MYHSSTESIIETCTPGIQTPSVGAPLSSVVMDEESNIGDIPIVSYDETPPPSVYVDQAPPPSVTEVIEPTVSLFDILPFQGMLLIKKYTKTINMLYSRKVFISK